MAFNPMQFYEFGKGRNLSAQDGEIQFVFKSASASDNVAYSLDYGDTFNISNPNISSFSYKNGSISSDGNTLHISTGNKYVKSTDRGLSFIENNFISFLISASDDGQYLLRATSNEVYVSNDYGVTWTLKLSLNSLGLSVSHSGRYQLVVGTSILRVSNDYGVTWTTVTTTKNLRGCAMSLDGKYMVATPFNSTLHYSDDYGVTWSNKGISKQLYTCAISNNGQHIVMGGNTFIRVSNDYGVTWTDRGVSATNTWFWSAISGSGQYMMIVQTIGLVYVSNDYGITWTTKLTSADWDACLINRKL